MENKNDFKPYIPADRVTPEITVTSVIIGIILAILTIFGVDQIFDISKYLNVPGIVSTIGSLIVFALIILSLLKFSIWKKKK